MTIKTESNVDAEIKPLQPYDGEFKELRKYSTVARRFHLFSKNLGMV